MGLSDKALAAMGAPVRPTASRVHLGDLSLSLRSDLDDYPGVIIVDGDKRLSVSPYGRAYLAQVRGPERWKVLGMHHPWNAREEFRDLLTDWPQAVLAVLDGLPDDPARCAAVPAAGDRLV